MCIIFSRQWPQLSKLSFCRSSIKLCRHGFVFFHQYTHKLPLTSILYKLITGTLITASVHKCSKTRFTSTTKPFLSFGQHLKQWCWCLWPACFCWTRLMCLNCFCSSSPSSWFHSSTKSLQLSNTFCCRMWCLSAPTQFSLIFTLLTSSWWQEATTTLKWILCVNLRTCRNWMFVF